MCFNVLHKEYKKIFEISSLPYSLLSFRRWDFWKAGVIRGKLM